MKWGNDNFKPNIHIIGIPNGEKKKVRICKIFEEIMAKIFTNLMVTINSQIQEAQ